jgi:cellulose synthase/poly-beta-1,6-N-acetylglucosamine synthase-like glycosyltransferase
VFRRVMRVPAAMLVGARLALAVPVGYLAVLTGAAWLAAATKRRAPSPPAKRTTRFAVLVPAHNEEPVIGSTLEALAALDYPVENYRVHVIADHCIDRTVEISRAAGAEVHEHAGERRGKGPALAWVIRTLLGAPADEAPDVVVVVDADTVVDKGFLQEIERVVRAGAAAVQGQYRVRDPDTSAAAGLRAAALAARHHLRPLGRTAIGASCGLYGNGMAFTSSVLRGREWSGHLTEDIEFQMELLLDGIRVAYAPAAVVEAEMPSTLEDAVTQNERWERGRIELARRYIPRLARATLTRSTGNRVATADAILDHLVPPLSVLGTAVGAVSIASAAVSGRAGRRAGLVLCAALGAHVTSALVLAGAPASVYRSLVHAPGMVLWKVRLWVRMLAGPGEGGWVRTAHRGAP